MKKSWIAMLALLLFALLIGCTEIQSSEPAGTQPSATEPAAEETVAVPSDKAEAYLFSGTWTSDDEQTVVPVLLHLYEDGTLVLEAHKNKAGNWKENEDGSLSIVIGEDAYTAKYAEILHSFAFRYHDMFDDEEMSVQMSISEDPAKIAEQNNQAMIDHIRETEAEEVYEGEGGEIIFYGGSNFQKWTTLENDLAAYPVVNKSIGGSNDPIRHEFIEERVYSRKPAVVFYMSSSNDWTSGQSKEEIVVYKQVLFDEMAEHLPDTVFVILSATPNPLRYFGEYHDGMVYVDAWTEAYCAEKANFEFLNVVPALSLNDGDAVNPDLWQSDKLHLNEDGYAILTQLVLNELDMVEQDYNVTFAAPVEIEEDGEAQRESWTTDWTAFTAWTEEDFAAKKIAYQLTGHWEMADGMAMEFYFLANLYTDGSLKIAQHSPTRGDNDYFGYWTQRDTEKGSRITLTTVSETPMGGEGELVPHTYSYQMFEDNGVYSFSYDFGIIPGSYMRAAELSGGAGATYESIDSMVSAQQ